MHDNLKGWCKQSGEAWITITNMMFYNKCFYDKKLGFCDKYVFTTKNFCCEFVATSSLINFIDE